MTLVECDVAKPRPITALAEPIRSTQNCGRYEVLRIVFELGQYRYSGNTGNCVPLHIPASGQCLWLLPAF